MIELERKGLFTPKKTEGQNLASEVAKLKKEKWLYGDFINSLTDGTWHEPSYEKINQLVQRIFLSKNQ